jgi:hypothetical protein
MTNRIPTIVAVLLGASLASAAAVVDDFNYTSGTTLDETLTGGTGWSGGYYPNNTLTGTTDTVFGVTDYTWTTPTFANTSGTYEIKNKRSVDTTGSGSALAARGLSSGINFDADGTYYFSYMMKTVSGIGQELDFFAGANEKLSVQYLGGSNTLRMTSNNASNSGTISATAGNDWFVVGKIETSAAGSDIFRLSVFENGDTVAATEGGWDLSHNGGTITGTADQVAQWKYFNTAVGIGNFRMDSTYAAVTSVIPEPSSFLLLGTALTAFVLFNRRRVK